MRTGRRIKETKKLTNYYMANRDVKLSEGTVFSGVPTRIYQVAASATLIYEGEPVKKSAVEDAVVIKSATAEPVTTDPTFCGIAASTSTNTAAAAGTVQVYQPLPGQTYICAAHTVANIDTQAEYDALVGERVNFDLTSTSFTIDENYSGATGGLVIVDLNVAKHPNMIAFRLRNTVLEEN